MSDSDLSRLIEVAQYLWDYGLPTWGDRVEQAVHDIEQLRTKLDEREKAARQIVQEVRATDPQFPHLKYWERCWPWLKETQ